MPTAAAVLAETNAIINIVIAAEMVEVRHWWRRSMAQVRQAMEG